MAELAYNFTAKAFGEIIARDKSTINVQLSLTAKPCSQRSKMHMVKPCMNTLLTYVASHARDEARRTRRSRRMNAMPSHAVELCFNELAVKN